MKLIENVMAVQKMQEYMECHITEPITLKQLADVCGYSSYHATRLFKEETGKSPFEYLRHLRLTQAAQILRDQDCLILDVALDFVFDSHEGFTRAFSKTFGVSPKKYRQNPPPVPYFIPYKAYDTYLAFHKGEMKMSEKEMEVNQVSEKKEMKPIFVQVIERPARKLLLLRGRQATEYFAYCEEVGCEVWGMLSSVKEALYEPVGLWMPIHLRPEGTSEYVQGVELPLDYNKTIPEGYELIELPPCKMMIFQGAPYDDEDFMAEIDEVMSYIDQFDPSIYGYEWAPEEAPRFQLAPMGYRGYIEGRAIKQS